MGLPSARLSISQKPLLRVLSTVLYGYLVRQVGRDPRCGVELYLTAKGTKRHKARHGPVWTRGRLQACLGLLGKRPPLACAKLNCFRGPGRGTLWQHGTDLQGERLLIPRKDGQLGSLDRQSATGDAMQSLDSKCNTLLDHPSRLSQCQARRKGPTFQQGQKGSEWGWGLNF